MAFLDCRDAALHALPDTAATPDRARLNPFVGPVTRLVAGSLDAPRAQPAFAPVAEHSAKLAPLEQRVVELARDDGIASLRAPRKRGWLARLVLGPTPPSRQLANERLEALRRLAVQAWDKGYLVPASALGDAFHAGFSEDQVGAVIDSIGRERSARQFAPL